MKRVVEIILLDSKEEYRAEYVRVYVKGSLGLHDIPVIFSEEDFNHIFSEPSQGGRVFSLRRAKKMMFIKAILGKLVKVELTYETDTGNIALFCQDLDCVMYLRIRPKTKSLQIGTFFDFGKDHTKMYQKQRRKCKEITVKELKEAVSSGPTTSRNADS